MAQVGSDLDRPRHFYPRQKFLKVQGMFIWVLPLRGIPCY